MFDLFVPNINPIQQLKQFSFKGELEQYEVIQLRNSGNQDKQIKITEVICHGFFIA